MQITLKQRDIELAMKMYLSAQGISLLQRSFNVEFTAGRKDSGLSASIDIGPAEALAEEVMESVKVVPIATHPLLNTPADPEPLIVETVISLPVTNEPEEPEGEVTTEAALAASVTWQDEPEVPAKAEAVAEPSPIFTPDAEVPIAALAPAPSLTSVSLFA